MCFLEDTYVGIIFFEVVKDQGTFDFIIKSPNIPGKDFQWGHDLGGQE